MSNFLKEVGQPLVYRAINPFIGLLARAGVEVTLLEKHADFLRDFRGDTVHASTLRLLDDLGLGEDFKKLTHRLITYYLVVVT